MSEPTLTSLRETADRLDEIMEVSSPLVHAKLTPMLRDAADVIEWLEHENAKLQEEDARLRSCLSDDAENARMIMGENAKLRELVRDMWGVMWACAEQRCTHRHEGCFRVHGNHGDICASERCWYEDRMRELGVEVDDGGDLV